MPEVSRHGAVVFNGPVDVALRVASILASIYPESATVDRLTTLDYLVVHTDDVDGGPSGLHPKTPHRSGEALIRREIVQQGLLLLAVRGLAKETPSPNGFRWSASESAGAFLDALVSPYARGLRQNAMWLAERFGDTSDENLRQFVEQNLGRWGAEFDWDPLPEVPGD